MSYREQRQEMLDRQKSKDESLRVKYAQFKQDRRFLRGLRLALLATAATIFVSILTLYQGLVRIRFELTIPAENMKALISLIGELAWMLPVVGMVAMFFVYAKIVFLNSELAILKVRIIGIELILGISHAEKVPSFYLRISLMVMRTIMFLMPPLLGMIVLGTLYKLSI